MGVERMVITRAIRSLSGVFMEVPFIHGSRMENIFYVKKNSKNR